MHAGARHARTDTSSWMLPSMFFPSCGRADAGPGPEEPVATEMTLDGADRLLICPGSGILRAPQAAARSETAQGGALP